MLDLDIVFSLSCNENLPYQLKAAIYITQFAAILFIMVSGFELLHENKKKNL